MERRAAVMTQLILTEEQARIVAQAPGGVEVCDPWGNVMGRLTPPYSAADIAEARRRLASDQPRYSADQVRARLEALQQEWDRLGGFDEAHLRALLQRLRAEANP
jgi:hypothetical protein